MVEGISIVKDFEDIINEIKRYENKPLSSENFDEIIQQVKDSKELGHKLNIILNNVEHYKEVLERLRLSSESNVSRLKGKYSSLEHQLKLEGIEQKQQPGKQMSLNDMSSLWKISKPTIQNRINELSAAKSKIPYYKEGRTKLYAITPETEAILKRESGKRLKAFLYEQKNTQFAETLADSETEGRNFMTKDEICKKYSLKTMQFNYKLKNIDLKKSGTRPQKYDITPEIEQFLISKERGKKMLMPKIAEHETAYDKNLIPISLNKIDLKAGAYMTADQIGEYFGRTDARIRIARQGEDSFKVEYLGKDFKAHYFIYDNNKYVFEKFGKGKKGADVNVYELCEGLNIEHEELFRKMQSLEIKIKHLNHGGTDIPFISLKDSERIKNVYK